MDETTYGDPQDVPAILILKCRAERSPGADALVIGADMLFVGRAEQLAALARRHAVRRSFRIVHSPLSMAASFLARIGIRIDYVPGLRFDRPHDRLHLAVAELIEIVWLHVLELRPDLARLRPLAILGE